jgi:hypothetical protein
MRKIIFIIFFSQILSAHAAITNITLESGNFNCSPDFIKNNPGVLYYVILENDDGYEKFKTVEQCETAQKELDSARAEASKKTEAEEIKTKKHKEIEEKENIERINARKKELAEYETIKAKEKKADDAMRAKYKAAGQSPYEKCLCNFNGCLGKRDFKCGYATKCFAITSQDFHNAINNHLAIYVIDSRAFCLDTAKGFLRGD